MIIVKCDMCGCDNECASKIDVFINRKSEDRKVTQYEQSI